MNFEWNEEQIAFRQRVRDFLKRTLPPDWDHVAHDGPASKEITAFSYRFCQELAREGLLVPHWPIEYGGGGGDAWQHFIVGEEMWAAGEPRGGQYMNVNWIGPALIHFASEEQKRLYIPPMVEGRTLWCQGFSEPGAGSDLANEQTRAIEEDDYYIVSGRKLWIIMGNYDD